MPLSFFFNDTATTEIYTLSLHDALPIYRAPPTTISGLGSTDVSFVMTSETPGSRPAVLAESATRSDRKSTRLNSSHANISYAVFCLKKKDVDERNFF